MAGDSKNGKGPYTRAITSRQAQEEHELFGRVKVTAKQHSSKSWKKCAACIRRMKGMSVWVDGKPLP